MDIYIYSLSNSLALGCSKLGIFTCNIFIFSGNSVSWKIFCILLPAQWYSKCSALVTVRIEVSSSGIFRASCLGYDIELMSRCSVDQMYVIPAESFFLHLDSACVISRNRRGTCRVKHGPIATIVSTRIVALSLYLSRYILVYCSHSFDQCVVQGINILEWDADHPESTCIASVSPRGKRRSTRAAVSRDTTKLVRKQQHCPYFLFLHYLLFGPGFDHSLSLTWRGTRQSFSNLALLVTCCSLLKVRVKYAAYSPKTPDTRHHPQ